MKKSLILLAALSAALFSTGAQAGHWKFDVVNKSNTAAVEFRTQENGDWSHNWIENRIESGDTFNMDFNHDDGDCSVRTQIQFADGSSFDAPTRHSKGAFRRSLPLSQRRSLSSVSRAFKMALLALKISSTNATSAVGR